MPKVDALVMNFYQELYPEPLLHDLKFKFSNLLNVGFISLSLPPPSLPPSPEDVTGCLSWLDGQKAKSVAFISFGTVVNIPQSEIEEVAEALEVSGIPFLWALRDSMSYCLPSGFLDRASTHGKVVPWAPQIQTGVLKSLDLILEREQGRGIRSRAQDLKELVLKASSPGGRASQDFKTLVEKITSV
ncbi:GLYCOSYLTRANSFERASE [Salix purpurea]|uniref:GLYCOSYLTRANSFERASE n=1 Tax=Salix purpurea TaxID=77065 RepID=A0A9Q0SXL5_SALPP|nr:GLYCOSYLTRANSFERASE [Salix purpurea]